MTNEIRTVAVVGAGIMGAQIAQVLAISGYSVRLHDVGEAQLTTALARISDHRFGMATAVKLGKLTRADMMEALSRISVGTDLAHAMHDADLAVEAVPEDMGLKVRIFRQMDTLAPDHAVLTSNAAGLPIAALAYATNRPDRVLGWHWAQPCVIMKMAELVVHAGTDQGAIDIVSGAARKCGKNPVVVNDQPLEWGYVANRVNRAVRREAARIVEEGVATEVQVDQLIKDCFNWPMGPFEHVDPLSFG